MVIKFTKQELLIIRLAIIARLDDAVSDIQVGHYRVILEKIKRLELQTK